MKRNTFNVLQLTVAFCLQFFSYTATTIIAQATVEAAVARGELKSAYAGYNALAIVYALFAGSALIAAPIVRRVGVRTTMTLASAIYALFVAQFLFLTELGLYVTAALVGIAAGPYWAAQGTFLAANSTVKTASRNAGLFWASNLHQVLSGIFFYMTTRNEQNGAHSLVTQRNVYIVYTSIAILTTILLATLRSPSPTSEFNSEVDKTPLGQNLAFTSIFGLIRRKSMLLVLAACFYTGIEWAFIEAIHPTSINSTHRLADNTRALIGLVAVMQGLGTVVGSLYAGDMLGTSRFLPTASRRGLVVGGLLVSSIALSLVFINMPDEAPLRITTNDAIIGKPQVWISLLCGLLLGVCDAIYSTQVMAYLIVYFKTQSTEAFAIYRICNAAGTCLMFVLGPSFGLRVQLMLMCVTAGMASGGFWLAERHNNRRVDTIK